jgi:uncharacterized protein
MPVSAEEGGARLCIRVTPRARKTALAGIVEADGRPALAIRLAAPPVDGAANKALIAFLASGMQIPKSKVRIVSGETGRLKTVSLSGADPALVARWMRGAG